MPFVQQSNPICGLCGGETPDCHCALGKPDTIPPLEEVERFQAKDKRKQSRVDYLSRWIGADHSWWCKNGHFDCSTHKDGRCYHETLVELDGLVIEEHRNLIWE